MCVARSLLDLRLLISVSQVLLDLKILLARAST